MTIPPTLPSLIFVLLYIGLLLRLSWIDLQHQLLPDNLTYPLLWSGLLYQVYLAPEDLAPAVIGAVVGYLSLWTIYWLYFYWRKQEGIGFGDMKLFAALGAWHGWQNLQWIIMIATVCGLLTVGTKRLMRGNSDLLFTTPLPFGPCLAIAGGVTGCLTLYSNNLLKLLLFFNL